MMKQEKEIAVMKAVAICYKPFLKPREAMIYCNLGHTQLAKKLNEFGINKTSSGYYKKEDLDMMMTGIIDKAKRMNIHLMEQKLRHF